MKLKFLPFAFHFALILTPMPGATASLNLPDPHQQQHSVQRRFDRDAKNSLSLGITAALALTLSPPLAICLGCSAFIYGRKAARHIRENPDSLKGKRMAEAGMVIGSIANPAGLIFLSGWLIAEKVKQIFKRKKGTKQ